MLASTPFLLVQPSILKATAAGGGTVLFDVSALSQGNSGVTSDSFSPGVHGFTFNIGSGSNGTTNRALWVALVFASSNAGTISAPSATWDGVSMTAIGGPYANGTTGDIYLFGLVNPNLGAKALAASWTTATQVTVYALSVVGADQTGGATTFRAVTSHSGTSATSSVTIAGNTGEIIAAAHMSPSNYSTPGNIDIGLQNTSAAWADAANRDTGSATLTYLSGGSGAFISAGCAIKAA